MNAGELIKGVLAGRRRALARTLSAVESGDEQLLRDLIAGLHPHTGGAHIIGITGPPGVGKSTLTGRLAAGQRARGRTVAVVAVDPSSPFSGGALLGDRVRMADHATDDGVFIRSMASRGHLGGLSWTTPQAVIVLDAAGFDVVIIETVGVGQAEVEIASVADSTIVAMAPGMGDAVQAAKAGILEIADVFVVNKADREGADQTLRELQGMQAHGPTGGPGGWTPPILKTVAETGEGIGAVQGSLDAHLTWSNAEGQRAIRRRRAAEVQVREIALATVRASIRTLEDGERLDALLDQVVDRRIDPYGAADELIADLRRTEPSDRSSTSTA